MGIATCQVRQICCKESKVWPYSLSSIARSRRLVVQVVHFLQSSYFRMVIARKSAAREYVTPTSQVRNFTTIARSNNVSGDGKQVGDGFEL